MVLQFWLDNSKGIWPVQSLSPTTAKRSLSLVTPGLTWSNSGKLAGQTKIKMHIIVKKCILIASLFWALFTLLLKSKV